MPVCSYKGCKIRVGIEGRTLCSSHYKSATRSSNCKVEKHRGLGKTASKYDRHLALLDFGKALLAEAIVPDMDKDQLTRASMILAGVQRVKQKMGAKPL